MNQILQEITTIPKELLEQVNFTKSDVLQNDAAKARLRNIYLLKAQSLGNLYKSKVKIYFRTADNQLLAVSATIWAADEDHVMLKGGMNIPTRAIWAIDL